MDAAGKTLDALAPEQAKGEATPDDLKEAAAKLELDMMQPGPNLVQRIIIKIRGG